MNSNGELIERRPHWILYHGTSSYRLKQILADNRLRLPRAGDPKISLTNERSVGQYFACNAVAGDRRDHPAEESRPVVLALDGGALLALRYELEAFSDDIWGDGKCDWENEIACWSDIDHLDEVLIDIERVPDERARPYFERRRKEYMPFGPRLAEYELCLMDGLIGQLEYGEISEPKADEVVVLMQRFREMVRSDQGGSVP